MLFRRISRSECLGRTFLGSGISPVDSIDSDIVELQHEDVLTMGERDNTDILRAVFDALPSLVLCRPGCQDSRVQCRRRPNC